MAAPVILAVLVGRGESLPLADAVAWASLAVGVAGLIGLPMLGRLGAWAERVIPARRTWRLKEPRDVIVYVAASSVSHTGVYPRPATGVGQARALAAIIPSLERAYRKIDVSNIRLSTSASGEQIASRDVICLGGSKNNEVTRRLLDALGQQVPADIVGDAIHWLGEDPAEFEGRAEDDAVVYDYGLAVRAPNPFAPGRTVVLLCGSRTFGTIAAAQFFVSELGRARRWRAPVGVAAVVGAEVIEGHVCEPRCLRLQEMA